MNFVEKVKITMDQSIRDKMLALGVSKKKFYEELGEDGILELELWVKKNYGVGVKHSFDGLILHFEFDYSDNLQSSNNCEKW